VFPSCKDSIACAFCGRSKHQDTPFLFFVKLCRQLPCKGGGIEPAVSTAGNLPTYLTSNVSDTQYSSFFMLKNDLPRALARGNKPFSTMGFSPQKPQGVKTPD